MVSHKPTTFSEPRNPADAETSESRKWTGLMAELRKQTKLAKIGVDLSGKGRPAITGREGTSVWDFLRFKDNTGNRDFTHYPHLTLAIQDTRLLVVVILPHGCASKYRRNLTDLGLEGFSNLINEVERSLSGVLQNVDDASPLMVMEQRHYPSRRAMAITDAKLEFDLRTAAPGDQLGVKYQKQWLEAAFEVLSNKRCNLQMVVGAALPYGSSVLQSKKIIDVVVNAWIACGPLIRQMLHGQKTEQSRPREK